MPPGVAEFVGSGIGAEDFKRPGRCKSSVSILPASNSSLRSMQAVHPLGGIGDAGGKQARQRGFEIEVEQDAANVEEEGHGGVDG